MFLYQGCYLYTEKETSFLSSWMAIFGLTATSMFEIWTPAWSSATTNCFKRDFFLILTELSFFFEPVFFLLFHQGLSSALYFCFSNDFSLIKEIPWVNFVKCAMWANYENNMKIEPKHERLSRTFPQRIPPGPRHLSDLLPFIWKYVI